LREAIITIDGINPVEFYGVNDANIEALRKQFPDLKIVARGNDIRLIGNETHIHAFNDKINKLLAHYKKFGSIDERILNQLLNDGSDEAFKQEINANTDVLVFGQNGLMVKARTPNQRKLVEATEKSDIVFAIGPAGTGKTYTAVALAVRALKNKEIKRIVLTRPAVEAGENLGFLPGDLKEKIDPYLRPLYDALFDMMPAEKVKTYIESNIIEVAPLAFMRGRTLDNAFVILDEAQNATESQLKMFLTRMGPSAKFIVTGDITQIDLPKNQPSGLVQATKILPGIKGIEFIYLDAQDVVRHRLVKDIIMAYSK
jgi:phosphate starvation-inducible PhoH-like protein